MKRVGIIRGGDWTNYANSLKQGGDILNYIQEKFADKYKPLDIFIDKNNVWHLNGLPILPADLIHRIDIAWNTSHPSFGQNLKILAIPIINANHFSISLKESRDMLRRHMEKTNIHIPNHFIIPVYQKDIDGDIENFAMRKAMEVIKKFPAPWIVKSFEKDISMGVHVVNIFPDLINAIIDGAEHGDSILIEELVPGNDYSAHVINDFRGEDVYIFGEGNLSNKEKENIFNQTKKLHTHLGNNHYLKCEFRISPRGLVYLKNISIHPDFKNDYSLLNAALDFGIKPEHIFDHILQKSL